MAKAALAVVFENRNRCAERVDQFFDRTADGDRSPACVGDREAETLAITAEQLDVGGTRVGLRRERFAVHVRAFPRRRRAKRSGAVAIEIGAFGWTQPRRQNDVGIRDQRLRVVASGPYLAMRSRNR